MDDENNQINSSPSLKHLTNPSYGKIPNSPNPSILEFGKPHLESFDYMLRGGLQQAIEDIPPLEFSTGNGEKNSIKVVEGRIAFPTVPIGTANITNSYIYPSECRQRGTTYKGKLILTILWSKNGEVKEYIERNLGEIPIMVKSLCCNLVKLTPTQLIKHGEDINEFGGYFIVNGLEKFIRMLIVPRRNYPIAMKRPGWKQRGKMFSEYGVSVRCVRDNHTVSTIVLHYLTNGTAKLMFSYNKEMFLVPVVLLLKALRNVTDQDIFRELIQGKENDSFYRGAVANMLRQIQNENLFTRKEILDYIGSKFRLKLYLPEWYTDEEVTKYLLQQCICIHLNCDEAKFNLLVFMTRKLFSVATGQCSLESADSPMNQEVLVGGYLYLMVLKEKISVWLQSIKMTIQKKCNVINKPFQKSDLLYALSRMNDIARPMEYFLATGNLVSKSGLGVAETSGLSVILDKINFLRFISHFQCVHRGSFFSQMRTTSVRKLLPEAWGFICPVHTPDGTPCGLLNHLTHSCKVTSVQNSIENVVNVLYKLGMIPLRSFSTDNLEKCYITLLDGRVMGWVPYELGLKFCQQLRYLKASGKEKIPSYLEIGFVPVTKSASQFPGIFLFSTPSRLMRPVRNLSTNTIELIGSFEQVYMNIAVTPDEIYPGITTHQELSKSSLLSTLAALIPFSDFNQSPRNMYQCQMAKQSMGIAHHAHQKKPQTKLYRLQSPNSPLVKGEMYDQLDLDDYSSGVNAIVAVVSYTGYDMEDAMTINKASLERGFAHGSIYKTETIDLQDLTGTSGRDLGAYTFGIDPNDKTILNFLDSDGLPSVGIFLTKGIPYYSYVNLNTGDVKVVYYHSLENAYVEDVRLLGNDTGSEMLHKVSITLRMPRNPIIGDKFASRHGQKGVCSQKWPAQDMPFTETGMVPDIIFNPHGFPSRMTIGMMIESMAGKSSACHGLVHDASPFIFSEDDPAADYFGKMLEAAGYNYYGTERLYSGVDGRELEANIFFGIVYYQRLRHMVADKFQVRTTGPIDKVTHQPVKGRKRAGGIRFGEMERDSLLAHGVSFLLQDRLFHCSDKSREYICVNCGNILSPILSIPKEGSKKNIANKLICALCERSDAIEVVVIPYVLKYLICELAAINIKVKLHVN